MKENKLLERGHIYFFYRPRVKPEHTGEAIVKSEKDIQRLYFILHPESCSIYRLLLVGHKRLPSTKNPQGKHWILVDKVTENKNALLKELDEKTYVTQTRGERVLPAVRPIGEGVYGITLYKGNTYFFYLLELPKKIGEVQKSLLIQSSALYLISVKNPAKPGIRKQNLAGFPNGMIKKFGHRRFIPSDPTDFLNYENAELLLIGASSYVSKKLNTQLEKQEQTLHSADIFNDLALWREKHPILPIITGKWA